MAIPGSADASVGIKIDVNDGNTQEKLAAVGTQLKALDKAGDSAAKGGLNDTSKQLDKMGKGMEKALKPGDMLEKMFSRLGKIAKYAGIEFGLLTATLGGLKLALLAGQYAVKGFQLALKGLGAAAGVAIGAIASLLAAMRELQAAQTAPLLGGLGGAKSTMNAFGGDRRFAMFDQKTMATIIRQAAQAGQTIDTAFRNSLARLGDFSFGDSKTLAGISEVFNQIQKQGKVTTDTYNQLKKASPALAKAFEEMTGGTRQAAAAAARGSVTYKQFFAAIQAGNLKALQPFNGALATINDTLIGRFKGSVQGVKELLTRIGEPLVNSLKRPLAALEREISIFLMKVGPTIQKIFPQLIGEDAPKLEKMIQRIFDRLATSINTNMPKLIGFGGHLRDIGNTIRSWFRSVGNWLKEITGPFDKLWKGVIKPLAEEIGKTLAHALRSFGKTIDATPLDGFTQGIRDLGNLVRGLIDGFSKLKQMLAPVVQTMLTLLGGFSEVANGPGGTIIAALLGAKMIGGLGKKGKGGKGGGGVAGGALTAAASMGMFGGGGGFASALMGLPFLGLSSFGGRTTTGDAGWKAYGVNRASGMGVIGSTLFSGSRASQYLAHREYGGMSRQDAFRFSSPSKAALLEGEIQKVLKNGLPNAGVEAEMKKLGYRRDVETLKDGSQKVSYLYNNAYQNGGMVDADLMMSEQEAQQLVGKKFKASRKQAEQLGMQQAKAMTKEARKPMIRMAAAMGATVAATMIGGRLQQTNRTSSIQQGIGGGLSGAGMGASMGAAFGPAGMALGALAGGALGVFSGIRNAGKERERLAKESRANVTAMLTGSSNFNRKSDFDQAFANEGEIKRSIALLGSGAGSISAEKAGREGQRATNIDRLMQQFLQYSSAQLGGNVTSKRMGGVAGGTYFYKNGRLLGDAEKDIVENLAKDFSAAQGFSSDVIEANVAGKDGKNAITLLEYMADPSYQGDIAAMNKQLDELKDKYGDTAAATSQMAAEVDKLKAKSQRFNSNMAHAVSITGMSTDEISNAFDAMGLSLSETSVGINEFNKLLGYTGDITADAATAAGRLARSLLSPIEEARNAADSRSRFEQQVTDYLQLRGPMTADQGIQSAASILDSTINNWTTAMATKGGPSFAEASTGIPSQIQEIIDQGLKQGVPQEVIDALKVQLEGIKEQLALAGSDPFVRSQFDSKFASDFTNKTNALLGTVNSQIGEQGMEPAKALGQATDELANFLTQNGLTVTEDTKAQLRQMLGASVLNSSTAITDAFATGGTQAALKIQAAMTGQPIPTFNTSGFFSNILNNLQSLVPNNNLNRQTSPGNPGKVNQQTSPGNPHGDTTSSRWASTVAAHSSFNSRLPGSRSITSGVRNFNLGSMSSDHLSGRAFDLVGDNLVGYASQVRQSGGFAEFHGDLGSRHLHVVPPIGDTTSSRGGAAMSGGGGVTNYYQFEIVGGPNADAEEIANRVMQKIERTQRSNRERS